MKTLCALIVVAVLASSAGIAQELTWEDEELTGPERTRPTMIQGCCSPEIYVYEAEYDVSCSLFFYPYWEEGNVRPVAFVLAHGGMAGDGEYAVDSLTTLPTQYGRLRPEFSSYQCMEGNWSWQVDMVDSLGISRANISRDCNQRISAVVNDFQVNLPRAAQRAPHRRELIGDME